MAFICTLCCLIIVHWYASQSSTIIVKDWSRISCCCRGLIPMSGLLEFGTTHKVMILNIKQVLVEWDYWNSSFIWFRNCWLCVFLFERRQQSWTQLKRHGRDLRQEVWKFILCTIIFRNSLMESIAPPTRGFGVWPPRIWRTLSRNRRRKVQRNLIKE